MLIRKILMNPFQAIKIMTGTKDKNHYDLLVPENLLFPKRGRELRTLICFNSKNRNGMRSYVLAKSKDLAREKKKFINLKFFGERLSVLAIKAVYLAL